MTGYYWLASGPDGDGDWWRTAHATGDEALAIALKAVRRSGRRKFREHGADCPVRVYRVTVTGSNASAIAYEAVSYERHGRALADPKVSRDIDRRLQAKVDAAWIHYLQHPRRPKPRKIEEDD
jgi:hypothetical protein